MTRLRTDENGSESPVRTNKGQGQCHRNPKGRPGRMLGVHCWQTISIHQGKFDDQMCPSVNPSRLLGLNLHDELTFTSISGTIKLKLTEEVYSTEVFSAGSPQSDSASNSA